MSEFWNLNPFAKTENFGPVLPNGRNATGMTKDEIYYAIHGKTQTQSQKELEDDLDQD